MRPSRLRLSVAAALFAAWIGWLLYLAIVSHDLVVLSRPQFLVANLHVVARLSGTTERPGAAVTIQEVAWAVDPKDRRLPDGPIQVWQLDQCGPEQGWLGSGSYILPLLKMGDGTFWLAPLPASPGFFPREPGEQLRIYPATEAARRQLQEIEAAWERGQRPADKGFNGSARPAPVTAWSLSRPGPWGCAW